MSDIQTPGVPFTKVVYTFKTETFSPIRKPFPLECFFTVKVPEHLDEDTVRYCMHQFSQLTTSHRRSWINTSKFYNCICTSMYVVSRLPFSWYKNRHRMKVAYGMPPACAVSISSPSASWNSFILCLDWFCRNLINIWQFIPFKLCSNNFGLKGRI